MINQNRCDIECTCEGMICTSVSKCGETFISTDLSSERDEMELHLLGFLQLENHRRCQTTALLYLKIAFKTLSEEMRSLITAMEEDRETHEVVCEANKLLQRRGSS